MMKIILGIIVDAFKDVFLLLNVNVGNTGFTLLQLFIFFAILSYVVYFIRENILQLGTIAVASFERVKTIDARQNEKIMPIVKVKDYKNMQKPRIRPMSKDERINSLRKKGK